MQDLLKKIEVQIATFVENADAQITKNNKSAGGRARKSALELTKLLKEFRKLSIEDTKK